MVKKHLCWSFIFLFLLFLTSACAGAQISPSTYPSTLEPHGPAAARIAELWWFMFGLGAVIWLVVVGLMFAALLRRRRSTSATDPESIGGDTGRNWPIFGGIVVPLIVIGVVFGYSIYTLAAIENPIEKPPIKIEIVGRRWWWEIKYPDQSVITANEIHLPVGVAAQVKLQTADVIHSFWIPELHGKMDLIPTRINNITLESDKIGVYRGECAEFCGLQHAHMGFMVVVESQADYDKWIKVQQQPAAAPADASAQRGQQVFLSVGCVFCHHVRGLEEQEKEIDRSCVDLGPDLTHLDSRLTIAGASLAQNRGNLTGWIIDAQHVKPGALMPNMNNMTSEDLQSLIAYLESLH